MTPKRFARLKQALLRRQHDLAVLADGVHKDHNISAIVRTCDAVGVPRLHAVSPGGEVRRHHIVAGGSKRWVDVELHDSTVDAFSAIRATGMRILAAHAAPHATDFREADLTQPTCIVFGSELIGPTTYAIENADAAIVIPMHGLVESLNVSVAAALILFEAERQRWAAGLYDRPPPDQQAFERTLFEWSYPKVAKRCRKLGLPYPELNDEGTLTRNPFDDL